MWPTRVACARAHVYEILANNFIAVTNAHTRAHKHIYILPFISAPLGRNMQTCLHIAPHTNVEFPQRREVLHSMTGATAASTDAAVAAAAARHKGLCAR